MLPTQTTNHTNGCHKCFQFSSHEKGARVYSDHMGILRTDVAFFKRLDPDIHAVSHQTVRSRLELSFSRLVTQFPLDVMHQIDLGVCKTILSSIRQRESLNPLRKEQIKELDALFISYCKYTPSEFARRPRSIVSDLPFFKATEYRQFVLYTGMVLLKEYLPEDQYNHFLLLSCSYRFLSSSIYNNKLNEVDNLLSLFVKDFKRIYGKLGYNIHNLLHITNCVREFGSINSFSAYSFENYMSSINNLIRGKRAILRQLQNRIAEFNRLGIKFCQEENPVNSQRKYSSKLNNCFIGLKNNQLGKILKREGEIVTVQMFKNLSPFFNYPVQSQAVGVFRVEGDGKIILESVNSIVDKFYGLPYGDGYILVSIL